MSYETLPKGRLEAFSDGVLAIVVTILVLELKVPEAHNNSSLLTELLHSWRNYVGYLVSFAFVGGFWVAHSNATRLISKGDPVLFRLNLVFLFFVSLLPFTTAMMTDYLGHPGQEAAVYKLVGGNLALGDVAMLAPGHVLASEPELLQSGKHPGKTNLTDADNAHFPEKITFRTHTDTASFRIRTSRIETSVTVSGNRIEIQSKKQTLCIDWA